MLHVDLELDALPLHASPARPPCPAAATRPDQEAKLCYHLTLNPDTVALGSTVTLFATVDAREPWNPSIFWSSENTAIATVSGTGVLTGVALGTAHIAASSGVGCGIAMVVVTPPGVASVRVSPTIAGIAVGGTVHLQAEPLDANGNTLSAAL